MQIGINNKQNSRYSKNLNNLGFGMETPNLNKFINVEARPQLVERLGQRQDDLILYIKKTWLGMLKLIVDKKYPEGSFKPVFEKVVRRTKLIQNLGDLSSDRFLQEIKEKDLLNQRSIKALADSEYEL